MPRLNRVDAILTGNRLLRQMSCGCKWDDNARPIAEHVYACDEHLARLRQRTVAILQRRRYAITAGHRSSVSRLLAWRADADGQRARIGLARWEDMQDDELEVIAYRSWRAVEQQLQRDLALLERVNAQYVVDVNA